VNYIYNMCASVVQTLLDYKVCFDAMATVMNKNHYNL